MGEIGGGVVFEALLADVAEEFLQARDLDYAGSAEGLQRIVGEAAVAYVTSDLAFAIAS
jgi:hypothetical protein